MQIHRLAAGLVAIALSAACSCAASAPINCSGANDDVEKAICSHADLLAQDQAISSRLDTLKQRCPAAQKMLVEGQTFWLRERSDCRNVEGVFDDPGGLSSCLAGRMEQRAKQLNDTGSGCDMTSLVATYRFVDVDYLRRFSARYVDKTVSVFGSLELQSCQDPGASTTAATVVGDDPKHERFRVRFSTMPAAQREFLCAQRPASHWTGTIRHDREGDYLYLTDVLGQKLPAS